MIQSIKDIVNKDLCVSCGACRTVCPMASISYEFHKGLFLPLINDSCISCGLCKQVCPSAEIDAHSLYGDALFTEPLASYTAFSKDENIRLISTSGGVVTTLVSQLLQTGLYENAYLLRYDNFNGQAILNSFSKNDDIYSTAKSKYIPASVENIIGDIKNGILKKTIVVCTPCQLLAILRTIKLYKRDRRNYLFIGLFCDKTLNYNVYKYFRYRFGDFTALNFRDKLAGGWPGNVTMYSNGKWRDVNKYERMKIKPLFQLNRCRYCFDKLNMMADISVGDCYVKEEFSASGKSSIIIRTQLGLDAFESCKDMFEFHQTSNKLICDSQNYEEKRKNLVRNNVGNGPYRNISPLLNENVQYDMAEDAASYNELKLGRKINSKAGYLFFCTYLKIMKSSKFQKLSNLIKRIFRLIYFPDKRYYVYIDNDGYENRGDQLMIDSITKEVRIHYPSAVIVVSPLTYSKDQTYYIKNNLLPLQKDHRKIVLSVFRYVYRNILNEEYVTPSQIDLVLNAKGYAYGDRWNIPEWAISSDKVFYNSFDKKGRRLVLLPQAFGPFGNEISIKRICQIYAMANRIYPREMTSFDFVAKAVGDTSKLKVVPDFTISSVPPEHSIVQLPAKSYVTIILNARMVDKTPSEVSENYIRLFHTIITCLQQQGENVIMLNHEGCDDEELMSRVNNTLDMKVPIITGLNGICVKAIIRDSKLVISSRYHGVVSGLLQMVPTLCTSWSHKYQELLVDHGCPSSILSVTEIEKSKEIVLDALSNPNKYMSSSENIDAIKNEVEDMWTEIFR